MKKKITTLFLTLALVVSVGAFAMISLQKSTVNATAETSNGVATELTVSPTTLYTFAEATPDTHEQGTETPAVAAWKDLFGMKKFVQKMSGTDIYAYVGFDEVDVTNYAFVNFKAMFWTEGGAGKVGSYFATDIYTAEMVDTGYDARIFGSWSSDCNMYTPNAMYVSIPTSAIKNAENKLSGFIVKNSAGSDWLMIGDVIFSNYCYTRVDTDNSKSVSGENTYGVTLQSATEATYVKSWKSEELIYRSSISAREAFTTTVKFATPVSATEVDYFRLKVVGWEDKAPYASVTLKNLNGTTVTTLDVYYDWSTAGDINCYFLADGLKNESGMIEGFILDCPKATNLLFADAVGYKGNVEPMISMAQSRSGDKALNRQTEWTAIPPVASEQLYYNGSAIENGTVKVAFKLPVDSAVYKTLDLKAFIWNGADLKDVEIRKLDGTLVETIKVKSSYQAEGNGDLSVKINSALLADENGKVGGFTMNVLNNKDGHLLFSEITGNVNEKEYTAKVVLGDGAEHTVTYTATNRTAKLEEIKALLGTNDAQYTYTNDVPAELPFAEGKTYTETRTVNEYDVVIGDATAVKVAYGEKLTKPATDPTKDMTVSTVYTFDGWYNGETKWDFDTNVVTGNVTLVAKFNETARQYDVVIGDASAVKVAYGEKVTKPADPTAEQRDGYTATFAGWYNGETKWDFDNDTVTGDLTLTPNFNYNAIEYTATINLGNGTQKEVKYTIESRNTKIDEIKAMLGTNDAQYTYTNDLPEVLPLEDKTYTETRTVNEYDVVIGDATAVKVAYGSKLTKPAEDPTKDMTASTVYTFDGWYNGETKWDFDNDVVTGNVTLTAKFTETARKYTVTITFTGVEKEAVTLQVEYNGSVDFNAYKEDGYDMVIRNGETEITELTVTGDVTLTVEYKQAKKSGCGSSVTGLGIVMLALVAGAVVAVCRKKQDR